MLSLVLYRYFVLKQKKFEKELGVIKTKVKRAYILLRKTSLQ